MPAWVGPAIFVCAYLLGSVSFGLLVARREGVDLRAVGSGNVGATNVGRALGKSTGRLVLALDAAKGAVPVLVARLLLSSASPWTSAAGIAAVLGHVFPVWHRFRGGKGAATGVGVMLAAEPIAGAVAVAGYLAGKRLSGRASVGSLLGAALGTATTWAWAPHDPRAWMATGVFAIVVGAHVPNIARLVQGTEPPS